MSPEPFPKPSKEEMNWAMAAHLSYFVLPFIGPLIVWQVKKEDSAFVIRHAKEALNAQLSVMLYSFALTATCIGAPLILAVAILAIVFAIQAALAAMDGLEWTYPWIIRFVK